MRYKKMFIVMALIIIFVVGLIPFSVRAITIYPTDQNNGGSITPTIDPFSDYKFNETYPKADELGIIWAYKYADLVGFTLASGSVSDTYVSDDSRIEFTSDGGTDYVTFYFSGNIPVDADFMITIETSLSGGGSVYVDADLYNYDTSHWDDGANLGATTSDQTVNQYWTNTNGQYCSGTSEPIKLRFTGASITAGYKLRIDYIAIKIKDSNGDYMTIWAEDFTHISEWSSSTASISTDGDSIKITPKPIWDFEYEAWGDPHDAGDENINGWNITDTVGKLGISSTQAYSGSNSLWFDIDSGMNVYTYFEKLDFTITQNFVIQFRVYVDCISTALSVLYVDFYDSSSVNFIHLAIDGAIGDIDVEHYDGSWHVLENNIAEDTWHTIKLECDLSTNTFDFWWDGTEKSTGNNFRNNVDDFHLFQIRGHWWNGDSNVYLDDVEFVSPTNISFTSTNDFIGYVFTENIYVETTTSNFIETNNCSGTLSLSDQNNNFLIGNLSSTIKRGNCKEATSDGTITELRIWYEASNTETITIDYIRFYKMEDYNYGGSSVNKGAIAYSDGSKLVMQIQPDDSGDEYWSLEIDIPDFETNTYKYFVYQAVELSSEANGYFKITYNDSSTSWPSFDTVNMTRTFELDANKKVDKLTIYINDNPNSLDSNTYYCYIYFITFSVAEINIDSITVNYEDTY
ncbi:MAG: hypothetical protein ACTSQY_11595, partial [Candidatus Odinarchaeia archaeon]